jgi:hypothetical protein
LSPKITVAKIEKFPDFSEIEDKTWERQLLLDY